MWVLVLWWKNVCYRFCFVDYCGSCCRVVYGGVNGIVGMGRCFCLFGVGCM